MNAPLYDSIAGLKDKFRFHTPGHKGRLGGIFTAVSPYDATELSVTDNLFFPENGLLEAEKLCAELFDVKISVFSAAGATLCIQTALSFFSGKTVLFDRNIHISAVNAAALCRIKPEFIYTETVAEGFSLPVTAEFVKKQLEQTDASALFITSPDYYGLCADVPAIKKVCDEYGVVLITDNSHGSHMHFTDRGKDAHASDIIIDSAHKTLPCLTGGAYLHFNIDISREEIKSHMFLFGSTSPSFLILASLDYARAWCAENGNLFIKTAAEVASLKKNLTENGIHVVDSELYDPLRLCVTCKNAATAVKKLEQNGIFAEMCDGENIVFLFTPFNERSDFAVLEQAISEYCGRDYTDRSTEIPKTVFSCGIFAALCAEKKSVTLSKAVGKTAGEAVIPYPPGVPVLLPGEKITDKTAEYLLTRHGINTVKVLE